MKPQHPSEHTEKYSSLLHGLLAPIRCARETPLRIEIDGAGIAALAWQDLLHEHPEIEHDDSAFAPPSLIAGLESVLGRQPSIGNHPESSGLLGALATWLQDLFETLRSIDPQAIEIAGLKAEGFDHRAISEGLDIGLRLVNRIVRDIESSPTALSRDGNEEQEIEETVSC